MQSNNNGFVDPKTHELIGSCSLLAGEVGQATIKLLNVDSKHKNKSIKIIKAIVKKLKLLGFDHVNFQRKTATGFKTVSKPI